jgi:hypothetical protein
MSKSKAALLAAYGLLAATAIPREREVYELTNPYADLPPLRYTGGDTKIQRKSQLTNKQQKARAAAKRAKKAKKRNR